MLQSGPKLNQQIYGEASDWLVRHRRGPLATSEKKEFDAWLRSSPEHIRAYLEISAVWEDLGAIDPLSCASPAELIGRAARDGSVVPIPEPRQTRASGEALPDGGRDLPLDTAIPRRRASYLRFTGMVAAACVVAALVRWWVREPSYSTGLAEQRSIRLADGSMVELNARSKIRVHFAAHERDIDLLRGQALFHVAKDRQRPFIVKADNTIIRAVGTQFDVNELNSGTVVTVVEGLVAVLGAPSSAHGGFTPSSSDAVASRAKLAAQLIHGLSGTIRPIFLSSGEQLTVLRQQLQEAVHVNVASAIAWTQHRLAFDAAPLSEVVEEFNRYNAHQLVIADPTLDDMRINGLFSSTDPSLLLQFLRNQPEISVQNVGDKIRISRK